MRRAQSINLPLVNTAFAGGTAGGATGSTNDAVLLFTSTDIGEGVTATDSATLGTTVSITRAGVYSLSMGFDLGASASVIFGLSLDVAAAGLTGNPSFANAGTLGVNGATAPASTVIPCTVGTTIVVSRVRAGQVGGATVRFLATDGSNAAPAGIVASSAWYRIERIGDYFR